VAHLVAGHVGDVVHVLHQHRVEAEPRIDFGLATTLVDQFLMSIL
jgi:hypothetical protein